MQEMFMGGKAGKCRRCIGELVKDRHAKYEGGGSVLLLLGFDFQFAIGAKDEDEVQPDTTTRDGLSLCAESTLD